jgi:hypothetical protein
MKAVFIYFLLVLVEETIVICLIWLFLSAVLGKGLDCSGTIFRVLQVLSNGDSTLFACVLLSIWKQRNNRVWNDVMDARCLVLERASSLLFEWEEARETRVSQKSVTNHENKVGIGICIRDEDSVLSRLRRNGIILSMICTWERPWACCRLFSGFMN